MIPSVPFSVHRWSDHSELERCTAALAAEIDARANRQRARKASTRPKFLSAIRLLILNAYACFKVSPTLTFGVSLGRDAFKPGSPYAAMRLSYTAFKNAVDGLVALSLLEIVALGFQDPRNGHRENTKIRGTKPLVMRLEGQHGISVPRVSGVGGPQVRIGKGEDEGKAAPDTKETRTLAANVERINAVLKRNWVDIYLTGDELRDLNDRLISSDSPGQRTSNAVDFTRRTLYRKFNDIGLTKGGRFYGAWWQSVPQTLRRLITINGKHTVEVDYSGLHPAILYATEAADMPEDPYDIDLPLDREAAKQAFMVLLNSGNRIAPATKADIAVPGATWDQIESAFRAKHSAIAKHFKSAAWGWLQRLDSDLAEAVMLSFVKMGYPCLPIHDSFIVHHGLEGDVVAAMEDAFATRFGTQARLKIKPRVLDDPPWKGDIGMGRGVEADGLIDSLSGRYADYEQRVEEGMKAAAFTPSPASPTKV